MCRAQHLQPAGRWAGSRHTVLYCSNASCIGAGGLIPDPQVSLKEIAKTTGEIVRHSVLPLGEVGEAPTAGRLSLGLGPQRAQGHESPRMPHVGSCLPRALLYLHVFCFLVIPIDRRRKRCLCLEARETQLLSGRMDVPPVPNRGQEEQIAMM